MADDPQAPGAGAGRQTEMGAFFSSLWGKIIATLATITMLGGIAAEGLSLYRSWQDSVIASNKMEESKAEQCSKRRKYILDYVPMNEWAETNRRLDEDCDPNFAAHKAEQEKTANECSKKLHAIFEAYGKIPAEQVMNNAIKHKETCVISDADRKWTTEKIKSVDAVINSKKETLAAMLADMQQKDKEHQAGHYDNAFKIAQKHAKSPFGKSFKHCRAFLELAGWTRV